jgi:hypothetical protein
MYNSVVLGPHTTVPLYQIICPLSLLSHSSILLALFQRTKTTHNISPKFYVTAPIGQSSKPPPPPLSTRKKSLLGQYFRKLSL